MTVCSKSMSSLVLQFLGLFELVFPGIGCNVDVDLSLTNSLNASLRFDIAESALCCLSAESATSAVQACIKDKLDINVLDYTQFLVDVVGVGGASRCESNWGSIAGQIPHECRKLCESKLTYLKE